MHLKVLEMQSPDVAWSAQGPTYLCVAMCDRAVAAAAAPLYGVQAKLQADICVLHGLTCYVTKEFFGHTEKF